MITASTHIIDTWEDFLRLKKYAEEVKSPFVFMDGESDHKSEKLAKLYGLAICFNNKRAFYIVFRNQSGTKTWTEDQEKQIAKWLLSTSQKKKLINHNILYDVLLLENNLGIDLTDHIYSDTLLLKHTIDEEPPFGLKELAYLHLGDWAVSAQEDLKESVLANGGKWTKENKDMYKADTPILAKYAMWDVLLTLELFKIFNTRLKEEGLEKFFYEEEVMPLYKECTIPMKRHGFPIDVEHFKRLKREIEDKLIQIEDEIILELKEDLSPFVSKLLDKELPLKNSGSMPKIIAERLNIPLPVKKTKDKETGEQYEAVTLAAKAIEAQKLVCPEHNNFYNWILGTEELALSKSVIFDIREKAYVEKKRKEAEKKDKDRRYAFNLNSTKHLAYYFFELRGYEPLAKTEGGDDKLNAEFIDSIKAEDETAQKIIDYKKLQKLLGTYVVGILKRQIDGRLYTSMLQFGTTSGRYSSADPNLQNWPRIKDEEAGLSETVMHYVNQIKRGLIAPKGYKIVNADFSQLEPCCFATASGEPRLQAIFHKGEDLYSRVAIDVFKKNEYSADKKAPNYLKKISPTFRDKSKIFTLAVPYGAEAARISQAMKVDFKAAQQVINAYLNAYPALKKYMQDCNKRAKTEGKVVSAFGRVRHLTRAKELYEKYGNDLLEWKWAKSKGLLAERREFKTLLNNAKNFPIQSMAASIVNRSMIAMARKMKGTIVGYIALQIHDEITCIISEEYAELAKQLLRQCMETTCTIAVPLIAEPIIADNMADAK